MTMVMFVEGGVDAFNASVYAQPSAQDISFFQNNISTFYSTLGAMGQNFFNGVRDRMESVDFDTLKQYTSSVARRVSSFWESDNIRPLRNLADVQFPPNTMIRWQMANPDVRTLYHKGLCEGYGEKYIDLQPDAKGDDHHDFQMVMHGMEQYDDNGDLFWMSYTENFDEPENSIDLLSMDERVDIVESWYVTSKHLKAMKDDPTSQYSGML